MKENEKKNVEYKLEKIKKKEKKAMGNDKAYLQKVRKDIENIYEDNNKIEKEKKDADNNADNKNKTNNDEHNDNINMKLNLSNNYFANSGTFNQGESSKFVQKLSEKHPKHMFQDAL